MVHYGGYEANDNWNDEWAMRTKENDFYKWRDRLLCYDHNNTEFREWWIQRGLEMVAHDEIDGIFIDGIVKTDKKFLPVKRHGLAYFQTARELRKRLPEGKLLIGNGLRAKTSNKNSYRKHLQYLDGSYLEGWCVQERLAPTLDLMSYALKIGRIIMLNAHPLHYDKALFNKMKSLDRRYDFIQKEEYIGFPLGFFLLSVAPNSYFSYRTSVDANPKQLAVFDNTRFEAVMRKLGKPLGDYVKESEYEYSREFEHLKVQVNLQTMKGVLTVKDDNGEEL